MFTGIVTDIGKVRSAEQRGMFEDKWTRFVIRNGWSWAPVALVAAAGLAVSPWIIRNKVEVGCFALTTDGRALWKANNAQTYGLLAQGKWIDDVKDPPHHPYPNPEEARDLYRLNGVKHQFADELAKEKHIHLRSDPSPTAQDDKRDW